MTRPAFARQLSSSRTESLLIFLLGLSLAFHSCVNDEKVVQQMFTKRVGVDEAVGVESYMSQGGKMRARLKAPLMLRYQDSLPRVEFTQSLHVDFFNDSLVVESQLDALFARYIENENKVFLRDSVRVFNTKQDTLFCQELYWDQNEQRFYTDKPVRIHQPGTIIHGVGLSAPQDFKTNTIYRITNSEIRVRDNATITDTASTPKPDSAALRFQRPVPAKQ